MRCQDEIPSDQSPYRSKNEIHDHEHMTENIISFQRIYEFPFKIISQQMGFSLWMVLPTLKPFPF